MRPSLRSSLSFAALGSAAAALVWAAGQSLARPVDPQIPTAASATETRAATPTLVEAASSTPVAVNVPLLRAATSPAARPATQPPAAESDPLPTPIPWPTPDSVVLRRRLRVPILMYHHVCPLPEDADALRAGLTVSSENFRDQLAYLSERGYTAIGFYDLTYALALGWPLPERPVLFTFDDAYEDIYTDAFPLMRQYGFTGTVFVPTEFVDRGLPGHMTWPMLEDLARRGWWLEPHTKDHVQISERDRDYVVYQVLGSMQTLQAHLGYQPRYFSYPAGEYDDRVIGILKEIGFWGAVTTEPGAVHDLKGAFTWRRIRIGGDTTLDEFAHFVENWDW